MQRSAPQLFGCSKLKIGQCRNRVAHAFGLRQVYSTI
jgi:hypothetical protein